MNKIFDYAVLLVSAWLLVSSIAYGNPPDFTQGATKPDNGSHDWNLGPTGARGWIYSNKLETSEARQIYITKVDTGSPAAGILQVGDVILGIENQKFSYDPRVEFGKAITKAEAEDGQLKLIIWSNGDVKNVLITLAVLGPYSPTAPYNCSKSKLILDRGCKVLVDKLESGRYKNRFIPKCYTLLALLASGNKEYWPMIKNEVKEAIDYILKDQRGIKKPWFYGPVNILVAEYTMATNDTSFLPSLKEITMQIVNGQSSVGSWGHNFVRKDNRLGGYGMINSPGIPLTISMILARKAGIKNSELDAAIDRSVTLLRFYAGKGCIPYGDHPPWLETHDDNGKNGMAAVMFNLLGEDKVTKYFSSMSVASHGPEKEFGHTGNFFNILWALPSVAISGPHATGAWLQEFGWYYDLARGWDGTYIHQGAPNEKPDKYKNWDASGIFLLAYAQSLRKIYLSGKVQNVVKPINRDEAAKYIEDGKGWSPRLRSSAYREYSDSKIFAGLKSWSPVVRDRSATELARRGEDPVKKLIDLLKLRDLNSRLGACQAIIKLESRAAPAVNELMTNLKINNIWLQIKAAQALAAIGQDAMPAVPQLLRMLSHRSHKVNDPRDMRQRYLCFVLFHPKDGLLAKSLENVNKRDLFDAVKAGLKNEDAAARGALRSVYDNLTLKELTPLLPSIYQAIIEPAPSGIMSSTEIQEAGLKLFAKHRISQGLLLAADFVKSQKKHGSSNRIRTILKIVESYGAHAKGVIPLLEEHVHYFENEEEFPKALSLQKAEVVKESIERIKNFTEEPKLIKVNLGNKYY